ncbi:hypothetical protein K431DRAFT_232622 [Polychaeton citri CBS 116435]|uniref:HNH domain-containing protein n=1 Tax=Polychaeton citri CBS 116435 TaxID=1314669 RepID=A0A9P4Q3V1_9PEZI|nr:hypothetical protein K431DRAFT_232622 [Polychaeton citri CBS 116435]
MISDDAGDNFQTFRECLSTTIIEKLAPPAHKRKKVKGRKNAIKPVTKPVTESDNAAADLSDFVEYLSEEIFPSLPDELRTLSYATVQNDGSIGEKYSLPLDSALLEVVLKPLPPSVADSLTSYNLIHDTTDLERFLEPALSSYISSTTAPPPEHAPSSSAARPDGCEICQREHLPLTYHHLIPRQVHEKAVKRGWAREWELQKVAWLCRACHSYVHRIASNEELARELNSVDALLEREDVQKFAQWMSRVRWKAR